MALFSSGWTTSGSANSTTAWADHCQSAIVYERREQAQLLYVIPESSVLGRLPLVPVGATGAIPFVMQRESADFPRASCYKSADGGDGYLLYLFYLLLLFLV